VRIFTIPVGIASRIITPCHTKIATPDAGKPTLAFAFRANGLSGSDLEALAVINKIALNQLQMDRLAGGTAYA